MVWLGKTKPLCEPILVIKLTLSNQAKVEKHQSLSMGSNLTLTDLSVCAAEISHNIMMKQFKLREYLV